MQNTTSQSEAERPAGSPFEPDSWSSRYLSAKNLILGGGVLASGVTAGLLVLFLVVLDDSDATSADQLQAPVTRGDLVDAVSSDGSIVLPERTTVSFGTPGTLAGLALEVGDTIREGDVIARLDDLTLARLATDVEEARTALSAAADRLADAKAPADPLELATARAAVLAAEQGVADDEEVLASLLSPPEDDLIAPTSAVTRAEIALENARTALADLEALPDQDAVSDARAALDLAQESFDNSQADLINIEDTWAASLADARDAADGAKSDYRESFATWLGYGVPDESLALEPSAILSSAGIELDAIFNPGPANFSFAAPGDDPATPWDELVVFGWNWLTPEQINGTCGGSTPASRTKCVEYELQISWDAVIAAQDSVNDTVSRSVSALFPARKSVDANRNALNAASDALDAAQQPATELELLGARDAVIVAESNLNAANDALEEKRTPAEADLVSARSNLEVARAKLDSARSALEDLMATGSDDELIALRISEVASAEAVLSDAEAVLDAATLRSHVSGVVSAVNFANGDEIQRNSQILEILDPTVVTVQMDVDQLDILSITVGAEASVTVDALPGQQLTGTVTEIGQAAIAGAGSVTFPVTVTIQAVEGAELLEGLSATAQVVSGARRDVLLVPAAAVGGTFTSPTLDLLRDGALTTVPIALGGGNETFAVVDSGVAEGDIVVFTLPDINQQTNAFNVFRQGFGGGGLGGGNFRGGGGGGFGGGGGGGNRGGGNTPGGGRGN